MNKKINSLYRTYRASDWGGIIGQGHVTQTLANQVKNGRVGHAYLFCGTRGTGKTSVARIFAAEVNGGKGNGLDTFEIDAASNNSVDNIRELVEKTKYPPSFAKYKVYIIDEVHMLSTSAFNAFLKTLEEPPSHVIFILCTTEPHKLPQTIQSRCLRFDFHSVSSAEIAKLLEKVFAQENITATPGAVKMLADAGRGSVRDALSFAETAAAFAAGGAKINITEKDVATVLGTVDAKVLDALIDAVLAGDSKTILELTDKIFAQGLNKNALVRDVMRLLMQRHATKADKKLVALLQKFAELEMSIKTAVDAQTLFEATCIVGV